MRMLRAAVALAAVLAAAVAIAPAASAGGWAVTYLDPLPDRVEPGRTYTVGYWVLQHGTHPYGGSDLGKTGLKLVDQRGETVTFHGVALPEAGHYATAWAIPHDGVWTVYGIQGFFEEYKVGTLTVPGSLAVLPAPSGGPGYNAKAWKEIRPPLEQAGITGVTGRAPAPPAPRAAPAVPAAARDATGSSLLWPVLLAVVVLAGGGFALLAARRRWTPRVGAPPT